MVMLSGGHALVDQKHFTQSYTGHSQLDCLLCCSSLSQ